MIKSSTGRLKAVLLALAFAFIALGLGLLTFRNAGAETTTVDPIAWYKFDDASNPGKDAMGNYNLSKIGDGAVTVADGQATFDGKASLAGASEAEDISETLTSFTLVFKMTPDADQGSRGPIIGFGWNDWNATKYGWFTLAQGGTDKLNPLRFSTHGVNDGSSGRDWGNEIKTDIAAGTEYSLALSVQLGGKITVYVDGVAVNYNFDVPTDWNLKDGNMRFSIGGDCVWGNLYEGFKGKISDVRIYGFAMTAAEISSYEESGQIAFSDLTAVPSSAEVDMTQSVRVPSGASEEDILKNLPTTSLIDVTMSDESVRKGTARWESVVEEGEDTYVEGTITDIANPNNVKARAKITVEENVVDILPAVSYDFTTSEDAMLKDNANGFDLTAVGEPEWSEEGVTLTYGDMLYDAGNSAGKDSVEYLKAATYSIKFRINEFAGADWWFLFSTGDMRETDRKVGFNLLIQGNSMLRIDTGIHDSWWGGELGTVTTGTWYQVDVVFDVEGVLNADGNPFAYVYVNGVAINQGDLVPVPLSGSTSTGDMIKKGEFAYQNSANTGMGIGGLYDNGEAYMESGASASVTFSQVEIYDFAMTAAQADTLYKAGHIQSNSVDKYIASVGTQPDFGENQPTKAQLLTSMPQSEMLSNLNAATVEATLSEGSKQSVAVNWVAVKQDESDGKWYAYGMAGGVGCGMPSAVAKSEVKAEVSVLEAFSVTLEQSEHGTISANVSGGVTGAKVIITATPEEHYYAKSIKVDGVELQAVEGVYSFEIAEKDVTVTAEFAMIEYALNVVESENGTVTLSKQAATYGETITITATPDEHCTLTQVKVNGEVIQPEGGAYTFTVTGEMTIEATFEVASYTVDVLPATNGTLTADKTSGTYGETVTLTVTPAEGYVIKSVTVNGTAITAGTDGKYTFTVEGDSTVRATFEKEQTDPGTDPDTDPDEPGTDPDTDSDKDTDKGGCGSSIVGATAGIAAAVLIAGCAAVIRKKKQD